MEGPAVSFRASALEVCFLDACSRVEVPSGYVMKMRSRPWYLLLLLTLLGRGWMDAQAAPPSPNNDSAQDAMSRDLLEVTIPKLEQMYSSHQYTVTQVVQWYLARIAKYNGIYRAVQTVDSDGALATAAKEDAEAAAGGSSFQRGPMWGVPIVTKANTSIKGLVTTDGWKGYMIPGHELIAPRDATIVAKLRAAGAIIIGQTNMPDFAASDTNRSTAMAAREMLTMCASAPEVLPEARLPPSRQTWRSWAMEPTPAIRSGCRRRPAPWLASSQRVAW